MQIFRNPYVLIGALLVIVIVLGTVSGSFREPQHSEPYMPPATHFRAPDDIAPTTGTANWWCLDRMACSHVREACDSDRHRVYVEHGMDRPCAPVDVAACLTIEKVLGGELTKECFASVAYCKERETWWQNTQPLDMKIVEDCVAE